MIRIEQVPFGTAIILIIVTPCHSSQPDNAEKNASASATALDAGTEASSSTSAFSDRVLAIFLGFGLVQSTAALVWTIKRTARKRVVMKIAETALTENLKALGAFEEIVEQDGVPLFSMDVSLFDTLVHAAFELFPRKQYEALNLARWEVFQFQRKLDLVASSNDGGRGQSLINACQCQKRQLREALEDALTALRGTLTT